MKKIISIILLGLFISSCSSYKSMINADSNIKKVEIGMTQEQVITIMGKSYQRIGVSQLSEDERMEILGYETMDYGIYNFYFINGTLTEWRKEWINKGNQSTSVNFSGTTDKSSTKIHLDAHRQIMLSGAKTEAERAAVNAHMDAHERAVLGN